MTFFLALASAFLFGTALGKWHEKRRAIRIIHREGMTDGFTGWERVLAAIRSDAS